jgi:hypothetical protein
MQVGGASGGIPESDDDFNWGNFGCEGDFGTPKELKTPHGLMPDFTDSRSRESRQVYLQGLGGCQWADGALIILSLHSAA